MPRVAMSGVLRPFSDSPLKRSSPALAPHRPMIVRSVVVLPAPLRPSSIVTSPSRTAKLTPCRMWYAPMCVCTPDSSSTVWSRWLMPPPWPCGPSPRGGASAFGTAAQRSCRLLRGHAEIGLLHDRRRDHRGRLAIGHELPVVQHDDAVRQLAHHVHLVLDQQDQAVL